MEATSNDGKQNIIPTSVRISRDTRERFRRVAEANHRSFTQELRKLIEDHIEEEEAA